MCGIAGFTRPADDAPAVLAAMVATLVHRGPDAEGTWRDGTLAMGQRRLAVIDLEGGAQPRIDAEDGDALVYNGEIYGYREHAEALRGDGVALRDRSDTEVLFHLIRRHGVREALERIDGMYAFVYREGRSGRLYLARDRFGEKPLFYGIANGALVFASEIKAIRKHPAFAGAGLDAAAIHRYLTYEYLPGELSGYAGIRKLQPGHLLIFENGEARIETYWRPRLGGCEPGLDEDQALDRLEELLDDSVRRRLVADVPVGVFLSGGVDSGLLAAIAARHSAGITAYTVRMPEASYDETPFAAAIAQRYGLTHQVVDLTEAEVMDAFGAVTAMIDEPLADYSLLPTYLVCRAARRGLTVALSGDGADELFAGYNSFKAFRLAGAMRWMPPAVGAVLRRALGLLPAGGGYMSPDFVLRHVSQGFGAPVDYQNFLWMAAFTEGEKDRLWRREALPEDRHTFAPIEALLAAGAPVEAIERLLYLFTTTYLPENILAKVDRASMYNSLEVRAPFLDRAFAEFALSLPHRWKVRGFETKFLLKRLAARHLPRDAVYRPKHGFALPLSDLLRGPLHEPVRDVLLDPANPLAGWFERTAIETYLKQHRAGTADHRKKLWTLYILFVVGAR